MMRKMTTAKQDRDFIEFVVTPYLLEMSIQWISENMEPRDVFSQEDLARWAKRNGYVKENA